MPLVFAGVDGEMSGGTQYGMENRSVYDGKGRLIQLGVSFDRFTCEKVNIGWSIDDMDWQEQAAKVHQIPLEEVTSKFPSAYDADDELFERIRVFYPDGERFIVPIGWNVASFDLPFIRFALPKFFTLVSRRSIDLNAVVYSMDHLFKIPGNKDTVGYTTLKKQSKIYARWKLLERGIEYRPHDAGWDAQMSILCYDYFRLVMSGNIPNLSNVKYE